MKKKPETKVCKHCKSEIPYSAKVCQNCGKKQSHKLRWGIIIVVAVIIIFALFGENDSSTPPEKKEYVKENNYDSVFSNPEKYKDKYIKISGKVFNVEEDDGTYVLQVWYDTQNSEKDFVVTTDKKFKEDDYIKIDGWITGQFSGENLLGGDISCPQINAVTADKSTYKDVVSPTLKDKTVNKSSTQYGVKITVQKVEFAKNETRVYIKVNNTSKYRVSIDAYSARAVQSGKQISINDNIYDTGYDEVESEVSAGASDTGIIVFKKMDADKPFTFEIGAYSDNYEIDMKDYKFEIK